MNVGGKEYEERHIVALALPPEQARHPPGTRTTVALCEGCSLRLLVEERVAAVVRGGGHLCCPDCAVRLYPDIVCGHDPDTGVPFTIRDMATRPNLIGGFR